MNTSTGAYRFREANYIQVPGSSNLYGLISFAECFNLYRAQGIDNVRVGAGQEDCKGDYNKRQIEEKLQHRFLLFSRAGKVLCIDGLQTASLAGNAHWNRKTVPFVNIPGDADIVSGAGGVAFSTYCSASGVEGKGWAKEGSLVIGIAIIKPSMDEGKQSKCFFNLYGMNKSLVEKEPKKELQNDIMAMCGNCQSNEIEYTPFFVKHFYLCAGYRTNEAEKNAESGNVFGDVRGLRSYFLLSGSDKCIHVYELQDGKDSEMCKHAEGTKPLVGQEDPIAVLKEDAKPTSATPLDGESKLNRPVVESYTRRHMLRQVSVETVTSLEEPISKKVGNGQSSDNEKAGKSTDQVNPTGPYGCYSELSDESREYFFPELNTAYEGGHKAVATCIDICRKDGALWTALGFDNGMVKLSYRPNHSVPDNVQCWYVFMGGVVTVVKFFYPNSKPGRSCLNLLVCCAVEQGAVYRNVEDSHLARPFLLPESKNYDSLLCATIVDVNWDSRNELIIGSYGQSMLMYEWIPNSNGIFDEFSAEYKLAKVEKLSNPVFGIYYEDITGDGVKELVVSTLGGVHVLQHDKDAIMERLKEATRLLQSVSHK
eukprot:Nk52_evm13s222 gene=Nk52_evmTU13s222